MTPLERGRLRVKDLEFRLPPAVSRVLRPLTGLQDPFRPVERRLGALFLHVPKAAGTSVARALFDDKSRHVPLVRYYAFDRAEAERCFKFTFVRNPWDRFRSAYHYLARRIGADPRWPDHRWATHYLAGTEFASFVDRMRRDRGYRAAIRRYIHFRDQLDWICLPGYATPAVDFVGRYERMQADFDAVCARLGVSVALPHERRGGGTPYVDDYSDADRDFVGELYARDAGAFGYRFGA